MNGYGRSGFTFAEVLIASATGMTIVAAVLSLYLFLSGEGRALRHQVEFNNKARVLQTVFEDLVEGNYCLLVDADNRGVTVYPNEAAMAGSASAADAIAEWIHFEPASSVADSQIVHYPNGRDQTGAGIPPRRVLCDWVAPADSGEPVFHIVTGSSVALCVHVGDPPVGSTEPDTTGPGRQGMNVVVIGSCRNLKRRLDQ